MISTRARLGCTFSINGTAGVHTGANNCLFRQMNRERGREMKVKNWMIRDLITIGPDASVRDAISLMHKHSIRHIPVVEGEVMEGLVTESNLRQYLLPAMVEDITIADVMIVNPITIDPNSSIDSAARLIHTYKIGGLPVMEKRRLVGIITITDILGAFIEFLGLLEDSSRIDIVIDEKKGNIDDVIRTIRELGGKIVSVGVDAQTSRKKVHYIRLDKCDIKPIVMAVEKLGHRVVSVLD